MADFTFIFWGLFCLFMVFIFPFLAQAIQNKLDTKNIDNQERKTDQYIRKKQHDIMHEHITMQRELAQEGEIPEGPHLKQTKQLIKWR